MGLATQFEKRWCMVIGGYLLVVNVRRDVAMSLRRMRTMFQQTSELKWGNEVGLSYCTIAGRVKRNSNTVFGSSGPTRIRKKL
ncbi:hypothetical protein TNCV_1732471 [Trichonephila clavipes]|nr:hypothetical protein TNCV_1732471 [Trichonephila clavipes]